MKTSIATIAIAGDLSKNLTAIANAGFDGVELFEQDLIAFNGSPQRLGEMVREHGLRIDLLQSVKEFGGLPAPLRARGFDVVERKFDLMQALGTELLLVSSCTPAASLGGVDRLASDLRELAERAARRGLRIGYEAVSWARIVADYRDAWELVRRADHPALGLVLDSIHVLADALSPEHIRIIPADRIFHVQLADAPLLRMELEYRSRNFRSLPGEGGLALADFMSAVAATGYDGPLSLEILNYRFHSGLPRTIAEDGYRSIVQLMDQVRTRQPEMVMQVPEMPAKSRAEGIEFIEFAADAEKVAGLERLLDTLGFVPLAHHINKRVALWRQGAINILINTEPKSFAHSAYTMYGTSVCDMALLVDDAQAAAARARALGANPFNQPHGKDELDIPAIRGVRGTVLHVVDQQSALGRIWETDFDLSLNGGQDISGVGLTRIDHISQVMDHGEMLTWTLFYTSIFEMSKMATINTVDPGGRVYSRALQSDDGGVRIVLNGADTQRSFSGRFDADSAGSSVQQLAFACDDIFATSEALAARGFEILSIPQDYYLDLAARCALDASLLERLRAADILYDEDANGAFYHLYSRPHGEGFFFEIVQRCGGYDGYGAANTPYRLAAQKKLKSKRGTSG